MDTPHYVDITPEMTSSIHRCAMDAFESSVCKFIPGITVVPSEPEILDPNRLYVTIGRIVGPSSLEDWNHVSSLYHTHYRTMIEMMKSELDKKSTKDGFLEVDGLQISLCSIPQGECGMRNIPKGSKDCSVNAYVFLKVVGC